ncbi:hypothetical protein OS493_016071 [Desmophyllum pertusum]|uniref:Uncharacterized protein n=1 Tax=Desmophyllum pertusum TaxID=174260 RepID=A0A9X0DBA6_9CNID|nr:hypothetical protein OS493_016071 [Desmophyllum pertusum]
MPPLKILLLLSVTLMLTHMIAGSPWPIEDHVLPPLESTNDTLRTRFDVVKRLVDSTRACEEIFYKLDPRAYFNSNDIFVPRFVYSIQCAGTPNNPPSCGSTIARMSCKTRMGKVEFMRIPRAQCFRRKRVVISGVPVGCYCV